LIEIGAHTVTHPVLPRLPLESQHEELRASRTQLEHWLGRPVTSMAFPHGEYSAGTLLAARECGFECAVTTQSGRVLQSTDPFQLPRFKVEDWDGERFGEKLEACLGRL
jgi:peptidoglycan/xylan/chitin deacetylase (PgdA/CDA1 family)